MISSSTIPDTNSNEFSHSPLPKITPKKTGTRLRSLIESKRLPAASTSSPLSSSSSFSSSSSLSLNSSVIASTSTTSSSSQFIASLDNPIDNEDWPWFDVEGEDDNETQEDYMEEFKISNDGLLLDEELVDEKQHGTRELPLEEKDEVRSKCNANKYQAEWMEQRLLSYKNNPNVFIFPGDSAYDHHYPSIIQLWQKTVIVLDPLRLFPLYSYQMQCGSDGCSSKQLHFKCWTSSSPRLCQHLNDIQFVYEARYECSEGHFTSAGKLFKSLPPSVVLHYPMKLVNSTFYSKELLNFIDTSIQDGWSQIARMIDEMRMKHFCDKLEMYFRDRLFIEQDTNRRLSGNKIDSGITISEDIDNPNQYNGCKNFNIHVVRMLAAAMMKVQTAHQILYMRSLPIGQVWKIDAHHKLARKIRVRRCLINKKTNERGYQTYYPFSSIINVWNEYGLCLTYKMASSQEIHHHKLLVNGLIQRCQLLNEKLPSVIYSDNCCSDRGWINECFRGKGQIQVKLDFWHARQRITDTMSKLHPKYNKFSKELRDAFLAKPAIRAYSNPTKDLEKERKMKPREEMEKAINLLIKLYKAADEEDTNQCQPLITPLTESEVKNLLVHVANGCLEDVVPLTILDRKYNTHLVRGTSVGEAMHRLVNLSVISGLTPQLTNLLYRRFISSYNMNRMNQYLFHNHYGPRDIAKVRLLNNLSRILFKNEKGHTLFQSFSNNLKDSLLDSTDIHENIGLSEVEEKDNARMITGRAWMEQNNLDLKKAFIIKRRPSIQLVEEKDGAQLKKRNIKVEDDESGVNTKADDAKPRKPKSWTRWGIKEREFVIKHINLHWEQIWIHFKAEHTGSEREKGTFRCYVHKLKKQLGIARDPQISSSSVPLPFITSVVPIPIPESVEAPDVLADSDTFSSVPSEIIKPFLTEDLAVSAQNSAYSDSISLQADAPAIGVEQEAEPQNLPDTKKGGSWNDDETELFNSMLPQFDKERKENRWAKMSEAWKKHAGWPNKEGQYIRKKSREEIYNRQKSLKISQKRKELKEEQVEESKKRKFEDRSLTSFFPAK